jgi:transketolase
VVLEAAALLAGHGIPPRVESFHTVKPLDEQRLEEVFATAALVVSVEEHGRVGGLGGSIAEWLASQSGTSARLLSFGTADTFLHQIGSQDYARRRFGLQAEAITQQVLAALGRA